mmetsp:Transcript_18413/g.44289  ORF Transcript_18413/g.44289 Transcript_18413/m.44289 type:complete len:209 (-) Transcript_18413:1356-1982(-)
MPFFIPAAIASTSFFSSKLPFRFKCVSCSPLPNTCSIFSTPSPWIIFEPRSKWVMEPMQDPRAAAPSAPTWFRCSPSRFKAVQLCRPSASAVAPSGPISLLNSTRTSKNGLPASASPNCVEPGSLSRFQLRSIPVSAWEPTTTAATLRPNTVDAASTTASFWLTLSTAASPRAPSAPTWLSRTLRRVSAEHGASRSATSSQTLGSAPV